MNWLKRQKGGLLFLFLLVFVSYFNSLNNEFVSDDIFGIVNNQKLGDFGEVFKNPFYFLRSLEYWMIFNLFGKQAFYFRLINFVFHLLTVWRVFGLVDLLIENKSFVLLKQNERNKKSKKGEGKRIGLLAASIFAVHPLGAEAVSWISAGSYVQMAGFGVWSLVFYMLAIPNKGETFVKYYVWSLALLLLALFTMERAVVVVGLMGLLSWNLGRLKVSWKYLVVPVILSLVWVGVSLWGVGVRAETLQVNYYNNSDSVNFFMQLPVAIGEYIKLFVWPIGLTLYHSDLLFTGFGFGVRVLVLFGLLGGVVWAYIKKSRMFFWLMWFLVCLSPTLLPLGISWIVAERYVYMAMIGLCVLVAMGVESLRERWDSDTVNFLLVLLVGVLMVRTVFRNQDWQTADELYLSAEPYSTLSPQNHNNLGDVYGKRGVLGLSRDHFLRAIELNPGYADAMHNLGNTYLNMGEIEKAKENFSKALKINPNLWQSENALKAIEELERKNP